MFNGKFISCNKGVSSKSGKEWYQIELIAETIDGGNKVLQAFSTQSAYNMCLGLKSMEDVKVFCGVTPNGYLTIHGVKGVSS